MSRVVVAGAGSPLGQAVCRALEARGHQAVPVTRAECDLADAEAVAGLAAQLGDVDGLLHLVGGWRGGGGLAGQGDDDWHWLEERLVTTLRNTTRSLLPALQRSGHAVVAIVSTTGLDRPTPSNANYLAAKAAAETWLSCVGRALRDSGGSVHVERVMALVTDADRESQPDKDFTKYTDVNDLAGRLAGLFDEQEAPHDHAA